LTIFDETRLDHAWGGPASDPMYLGTAPDDYDDLLDLTPGAGLDLPPARELTPPPTERAASEPGMGSMMLREILETLVLTLVLFVLIRTGMQNYKIEGQSMQPNFQDGEYLLVNKLAYVLNEPKRGDVVVFHYPRDPERDFIKRIVGLPGDTVEVRDGQVYVNGFHVQEPYATNPTNYSAGLTVVDPGTVYVLGDNRGNSEDSHRWGLLNQDLIIGTAWVVLYPFSKAGEVAHQEPLLAMPTALGP